MDAFKKPHTSSSRELLKATETQLAALKASELKVFVKARLPDTTSLPNKGTPGSAESSLISLAKGALRLAVVLKVSFPAVAAQAPAAPLEPIVVNATAVVAESKGFGMQPLPFKILAKPA